MKEIIIIALIGILIFSGFGEVAISQVNKNEENILKKIESVLLSEPIIQEKGKYLTVDFEESTSLFFEKGKPLLPVITKLFIFPLGTKIVDVSVDYEVEEFVLSRKIQPTPMPAISSRSFLQEPSVLTLDDVYTSSELYPSKPYTISKGAGLNNLDHVLFLNLKFAPQYSPIDNLLLVPREIEITVEYILPEKPLFISDTYDMVIIAPSQFLSVLQSLMDHKNSYGIRTFLKTTEEIYIEFDGCDKAEQIKYFIKDAIEKWGISYVLLVGSIDLLPIRKTSINGAIPQELPTDLYYADVYDANGSFCSWDSNHNDVFGEYNWLNSMNFTAEYIDFVDLYPDVSLGRFPCRNKFEVKTVVNKIINYETHTYEKEWFNRIILMGGDTFPWYETIEGELVTEYIAQLMPEFEPIKLWTSTNNFNPRSVNQEISKGAGFVSYSGHGYALGIATYPTEIEEAITYNLFNLFGQRNGDKLPVVYYDACLTAKLDYKLYGVKIPCFAWFTMKNPFGGAIAVIGSTGIGYGGLPGDPLAAGCPRLQAYFFEAYEKGKTVSQMLTNSQNEYLNNIWKDCLTLEEFNLLGDPSLKIGGYPKE